MKGNTKEKKCSFANINLMGKCNANCYFCLGKDIEELLSKHNQMSVHFSEWTNLDKFLNLCKNYGVKKIYLTGENTDPLIYKYFAELVDHIQALGFDVGLRCNGYLAMRNIEAINRCNDEIGYSVHTLKSETNKLVMGRDDIPNWYEIIPRTNNPRISTTITRYNKNEFIDVVKYLSQFGNIKYIQARCVVSETRNELIKEDQDAFLELSEEIEKQFIKTGEYSGTPIYSIYGMSVSLWNCWGANANSLNYFADGTISESPYIIDGYIKNNTTTMQRTT